MGFHLRSERRQLSGPRIGSPDPLRFFYLLVEEMPDARMIGSGRTGKKVHPDHAVEEDVERFFRPGRIG